METVEYQPDECMHRMEEQEFINFLHELQHRGITVNAAKCHRRYAPRIIAKFQLQSTGRRYSERQYERAMERLILRKEIRLTGDVFPGRTTSPHWICAWPVDKDTLFLNTNLATEDNSISEPESSDDQFDVQQHVYDVFCLIEPTLTKLLQTAQKNGNAETLKLKIGQGLPKTLLKEFGS